MCFIVKLGGLFHISVTSLVGKFYNFFLQTSVVFCQDRPSVFGGYHELIGNSALMAGHTFYKYLIYAFP